MGTAAVGAIAQLGTDPSSTTVTQRFEFVSESVGKRGTIIETGGIRGTRSHSKERTRVGPYSVGGTIVMEPSPEELAIWLPRILGTAASGTTYALAETLPTFVLVVDRVTKVFTYEGCKVASATFGFRKGVAMSLSMNIIGTTESIGNAGTFPSLSLGTTGPFTLTDTSGAVTILSVVRPVFDFEVTIDNGAVADRHLNATTVSQIPITDRVITLRSTHPYSSDETDLYDQAITGGAGTIVATYAGYSLTFAFANLQAPAEAPTVGSKGEILLSLNSIAKQSGATKELIVTLDSSP